jgi:hypothetical protein
MASIMRQHWRWLMWAPFATPDGVKQHGIEERAVVDSVAQEASLASLRTNLEQGFGKPSL